MVHGFDVADALRAIGAFLIVTGPFVMGHRVELWLRRNTGVIDRLPRGIGAWAGLIAGLGILATAALR